VPHEGLSFHCLEASGRVELSQGTQDWIPDSVWLNVLALGAIDSLRDMPDSVIKEEGAWKAWYDQEAPERSDIPGYQGRLSKFDRMCVVKVLLWNSFLGLVGPHDLQCVLSYLLFLIGYSSPPPPSPAVRIHPGPDRGTRAGPS